MAAKHTVIVVGGGIAGLTCAMKLAEEGVHVDLFSLIPVRRSHSASAQGGINACNHIARQQGFSEWLHFDETIHGGDFLADQPPVHEMCYSAPAIVDLLDRMGVNFNRTLEGQRDLRRMGGSLVKRTFFAGATTGQQILNAMDEQVRRFEAGGAVRKFEYWEFLSPVLHDVAASHVCVGIVAQDLRTMQIHVFRADAVVIATGNHAQLFARSTASLYCTGAAVSRCYQAGAELANPEFIQLHPTTIPGEDKSRLISEAALGEGGRLWVPAIRENGQWKPHPNAARTAAAIPANERYYFLEERYPKFANLLPRDIAVREIFRIRSEGLGAGDGNLVYLDLTDAAAPIGRENLARKLHGPLEIYRHFAGSDPLEEPMKILPAVHGAMGGLRTIFKKDEKTGGLRAGDPANLSTNIPGLYAIGEASFAYHGANRLGGNGLLSRVFDGLFAGPCIKNYCTDAAPSAETPQAIFDHALRRETQRVDALLAADGTENPHQLRREITRAMTDHCTAIRHNESLKLVLQRCSDWKERSTRIQLADSSSWFNQSLPYARNIRDMIILAEAILKAALLRDESRGAHFKPDRPDRDDAHYLQTTVVTADGKTAAPIIRYEPVDTSLIAPRPRDFGRKPETVAPVAQPAVRA